MRNSPSPPRRTPRWPWLARQLWGSPIDPDWIYRPSDLRRCDARVIDNQIVSGYVESDGSRIRITAAGLRNCSSENSL